MLHFLKRFAFVADQFAISQGQAVELLTCFLSPSLEQPLRTNIAAIGLKNAVRELALGNTDTFSKDVAWRAIQSFQLHWDSLPSSLVSLKFLFLNWESNLSAKELMLLLKFKLFDFLSKDQRTAFERLESKHRLLQDGPLSFGQLIELFQQFEQPVKYAKAIHVITQNSASTPQEVE